LEHEPLSQAVAIRELARQVRAITLHLLADARLEWLTWAPPGTSNHMLWHAGHALWVVDVLCLEPLTGRSELPPGWENTFGMDCRPVAQIKDWPSRETVLELLTTQLEHFNAALANTNDEIFIKVIDKRGNTLMTQVIHGLHDEAKHQGEMFLLTKICRAGKLFG
jgi:hypothetical protein